MRFTLFKKGLLLLAVPVGLQLVTIGLFMQKYSEINTGLQYQLASIRVGQKMAEASELTMQMGEHLLTESANPNLQSYGPALEVYGRLSEKLYELKSIRCEFPDIENCAVRLSRITSKHLSKFSDKAMDVTETQNPLWYLDSFRYLYKDMAPDLEWLSERPFSPALAQFSAARNARVVILAVMYASIGMNIAAALLLWWLINSSVVKQVEHLKTNFDRLARNEPLLEPLKGTDEVADFDLKFQEIGRGVESIRRERTEYLEIMSSTMREPLQKLQETLKSTASKYEESISEKGKQKLEASSRTINRLVEMLNELIDYEQIDQGTFTLNSRETTAQDVLSDAIECIVDRAGGSNVKIEHEEYELSFKADPDRLVQVLVNLLTNAIKFSQPASTVRIAVEQIGGETIFSVIDQGPGIEPQMQTKIFERFEQVDQARDSISKKGTGLGLAICKVIVETHGGKIWVQSTPGEGSTFKFSIPA